MAQLPDPDRPAMFDAGLIPFDLVAPTQLLVPKYTPLGRCPICGKDGLIPKLGHRDIHEPCHRKRRVWELKLKRLDRDPQLREAEETIWEAIREADRIRDAKIAELDPPGWLYVPEAPWHADDDIF